MAVRLLAITPDAERLIEQAGRVCWRSELSPTVAGTTAFIQALIRRGHLSPTEHASATFLIEGISRTCSHQLVRHRLASYSQESLRYVEPDDGGFVIPPAIHDNQPAQERYLAAMGRLWADYEELRRLGVPKEDARFLLPLATETTIALSANFRELRYIIETRCDPHAQWEIRAVATCILELLYAEAPAVFGDLYERFCAPHLG